MGKRSKRDGRTAIDDAEGGSQYGGGGLGGGPRTTSLRNDRLECEAVAEILRGAKDIAGSAGRTLDENVLFFVDGNEYASMETLLQTLGGCAYRLVKATGLGLTPTMQKRAVENGATLLSHHKGDRLGATTSTARVYTRYRRAYCFGVCGQCARFARERLEKMSGTSGTIKP